jgi:hypothetical protein
MFSGKYSADRINHRRGQHVLRNENTRACESDCERRKGKMRFKELSRSGYLLAAMLLVPGMSLATTPIMTSQKCTPGEPTEASYTWNFPKEASSLLNGVRADALKVNDQAQQLEDFSKNPSMDWRADADKLSQIRQDVNDMSNKLCRLETIRRVVLPWQQEAIDRTSRIVRLMSDNTADAIVFINANQEDLWSPTFNKYAKNLAQESNQVSTSVRHFEEYAQLHNEKTPVKKTLGVQAGS